MEKQRVIMPKLTPQTTFRSVATANFQVNSGEVFPGGSDSEESTCNAGDPGLTPGFRRSLGERNGKPLQYSSLENSMDRGTWWATVPWSHKESEHD